MDQEILRLSDPDEGIRLDALRQLSKSGDKPSTGRDVNNHIHTTYSFSPYSPSSALWHAYMSGLCTAGIMDHDSVSGLREFIEAGRILSFPITCGVECRVDMRGTALEGKSINNPDQHSVAYVALHGIPHSQIDTVDRYLAPYREARGLRNRKMCSNLNSILNPYGITLDYDLDVLPLSMAHRGGSVTERHILFAVAKKMSENPGPGQETIDLLESMGVALSPKQHTMLSNAKSPYYDYDLLGILKGSFVEKFYVDATAECPKVTELASLANEVGAILAYAYLGDVEESVTGDKKAQRFEDSYLDLLFETLHSLGFHAVTYMPSRNTPPQLERLRKLCAEHNFFQISGEDINQPRQEFVCKAMRSPEFSNLFSSAWALIGHELAATDDISKGMFSPQNITKPLDSRIEKFKNIALKHYT